MVKSDVSAKRPELKSPRRLKPAVAKRGRYQKRITHSGLKLPSSWVTLKDSLSLLGRNKRLFSELVIAYGVLSVLLVRGLSNTAQLTSTKQALLTDKSSSLKTSFNLVGSLFGSSGSGSSTGSTYQTVLLVIISLAIIWALRQVYDKEAAKKLSIKAIFYQSTGQLIPFFLVVLTMSLQLIPAIIGGTIYSIVVSNGLAVSFAERLGWAGLFFVLVTWSLYMATTSIVAMYIVTLPDFTPIKALKSARDLVRYRHWTVMRKVLFLPLFLALFTVIVMLPIVLWLTPLAEWIFFIIGLGSLVIAHTYLYNLYRELL